eukprot:4004480-Prymnesium_polylepis.1
MVRTSACCAAESERGATVAAFGATQPHIVSSSGGVARGYMSTSSSRKEAWPSRLRSSAANSDSASASRKAAVVDVRRWPLCRLVMYDAARLRSSSLCSRPSTAPGI